MEQGGSMIEHDLKYDVEFSCPEHTEIISVEPGECPICGETLEEIYI